MSTDPGIPKPIIVENRSRFSTAGAALAMREPSRSHAIFRGGVAAFLVLAAVANLVAATGFPSAAPLELLLMLLLSVDMFIGALALTVFAVLAGTRRSVPVRTDRTSPMSLAAVTLAGVAFIAWVLFGLLPALVAIGTGETVRYITLVGVLVLFGIPWMLGIVFGTTALRSGGPRTALFAGVALGLGILLVLAVVAATVLYALGLTQ